MALQKIMFLMKLDYEALNIFNLLYLSEKVWKKFNCSNKKIMSLKDVVVSYNVRFILLHLSWHIFLTNICSCSKWTDYLTMYNTSVVKVISLIHQCWRKLCPAESSWRPGFSIAPLLTQLLYNWIWLLKLSHCEAAAAVSIDVFPNQAQICKVGPLHHHWH